MIAFIDLIRDSWAATWRFPLRHPKPSAIAAGILVAVISAYAVWLYSGARSVEDLLDRAEAVDVAAGGDSVLETTRDVDQLVEDSERTIDSLSGRLGPVRIARSVFGWVPWAGDQLRAPDLLIARARAAINLTEALSDAAVSVEMIRTQIESGQFADPTTSGAIDEQISVLNAQVDRSESLVQPVREASRAMDGMSLLGVFERRARRVSTLEQKLLDYSEVFRLLPPAVTQARAVMTAASDVLDGLTGASGSSGVDDLAAAMVQLAQAAEPAAKSMRALEMSVSEKLPGSELAASLSDLSASLDAVAELSAGLGTITDAFQSMLDILGGSKTSLLSDGDTVTRALESLLQKRDELGAASDRSTAAITTLSNLVASGRADFLPSDLTTSLLEQPGLVLGAGELLRDGPELLLDLLGANGTKKYLVLGQTSDELRAAGGFTSSAWTFTFSGGELVETEYIPILQFDDFGNLAAAPRTASPLAYYMDAGALYLRDVGWAPDFASVGALASDLYRLFQQDDIDGVIAVTQWGIVRLVDAIGGIEVNGEFVSPEETLSLIEERTDEEGTGFLQQLFVGLIDSLNGETLATSQLDLLKTLNEIIREKDLMLFSNDDAEQALVEALDFGGRFPVDGNDRLAIVDSNVGWSKSDRSVEREAHYTVDMTQPGNPTATLTLLYRNAGDDIGRSCATHSPPPAEFAPYSVSVNSCYWNYVRAYVATGIDLASAPEFPLPANSVPDVLGLQDPGTPTFVHDFDEYGDHLDGFFNVAPGDFATSSFEYDLPTSVLQMTETGFEYTLELVAQPGARGRDVRVELLLPKGYSLNSTSHVPVANDDGNVTYELNLLTDQTLHIEVTGD